MKINQDFLGGGTGVQKENLPWEEYGYFLELHNVLSGVHYVLSGVISYLNDIDMCINKVLQLNPDNSNPR